MAKKAEQKSRAVQPAKQPGGLDGVNTQKLQLRDLRVLTSSTFLNPLINPQDLPKEVNQEIKVHSARSDGDSSLLYMIDFALKSNLENGDPALSVAVRFGLIYKFQTLDGIGDKEAQIFGQTTGLFCIWPYWREFVQNMVARMGLPPIRIPPMRPLDLQFSAHRQVEKIDSAAPKKRRK